MAATIHQLAIMYRYNASDLPLPGSQQFRAGSKFFNQLTISVEV